MLAVTNASFSQTDTSALYDLNFTANGKYHCTTIWASCQTCEAKTITFLYDKFTQDNVYQILSESGVVDCISKNVLDQKTFWCVFSAHSVVTNKSNILK